MRISTTMVVCFIALAAFGMILPAGAATSVSIGSATSSTCDTVSITVDTDDADGIGTATLTVGYDPSKVSLDSVSNGALGDVTYSDVAGTITLYAVSATACPTGNGITFADIEFCPVTGASGCSDLNLEVTTLADCIGTSITPDSVNDGTFCISGGSPSTTTVSIGSATSSTCDTVSITVDTDDADGIGTATLTVGYDPSKVSLGSVSNGALGDVTYSDVAGTITLYAVSATACPTGNGITFADIEFCPVTGASGCSDLNLEVTTLADCIGTSITPDSVNDGTFCISGGSPSTTTVSIGSATSSTCDTVSITVDTDDADGIGTATLTVGYDPSKVSLGSVSNGALGDVTYSDVAGTITLYAVSATACPTGNGITFADIEFCPVTGASGCSDLNLEVTTLADCIGTSITPDSVNDGTFCISGGSPSTTTVSIGSATSSTCDTVSITVDTDDADGIGTATLTVGYDSSKVSLDSVSNGALGDVTYSDVAGTITLYAVSATACPTGNGITVADIEFCPVTGASGCSDLNLEVTTLADCIGTSITPDSVNDGTFCIGVPDDDPTVTLIYPTDGEEMSGDVTLNASAIADPDGSIVSVVFHHSDDDGSIWTEIGTGAASGIYYTCAWDTKTVDNGDYKVKAVAEDDLAGTGAGEDESDVSIDNGFCLRLEAGLNFVSIPKTLDGSNVAETVFSIDSYAGEFCLYYNAATKSYDTNPLVKPCRGYWVYKNAATPICVSFDYTAMGPSQQLYEGWNMIGHIDTEELPIYEAGNTADFGSVTGLEEPEETKLFRQVSTYTQDPRWINYPTGDLTEMTPGTGYWILMKGDVMMYGMP